MAENILFIFEGARTERIIARSFLNHYISGDSRVVISSFGTDIYMLYRELKGDEYLDIFSLMKERDPYLADFSKDSFSQIYLFFDYDGHAPAANDDHLVEMIEFFDEETESGKLLISYPMVEALKCIKDVELAEEFYDYTHEIKGCSAFKGFVSNYAHPSLINFNSYDLARWNAVIRLHCVKSNVLVHGKKTFPLSNITQIEVFNNQKVKHIDKDGKVATLSAFPLLLLDFYGHTELLRRLGG